MDKLFAYFILQHLQRLAEMVYPGSQSGHRSGKNTINSIFILGQVIEKNEEQQQNLHITFINFTNFFDCFIR